MTGQRVIIFCKERHGLADAVSYLQNNFSHVRVFRGNVGDRFPEAARKGACDICISYMSPWIIPKRMLAGVRKFSINFHPGPPGYRGIGCTNFAIYNNESIYGVTAHLMTPRVDAGRIVSVKYFPILQGDSLFSLTQKCYRQILVLFYGVFGHYLTRGDLPKSDAVWGKHLYTRKELNELCSIRSGMSRLEIAKRIRATDFPNMPKAYIEL